MKTNKSLSKRLKVTRKGKVLARKGGQNHFNAKEGRQDQLTSKRWQPIKLSTKEKARFLPNL